MDMNREFPKLFEPDDEVAPFAARKLHFYVFLVTCQMNDGGDKEGVFSTECSMRSFGNESALSARRLIFSACSRAGSTFCRGIWAAIDIGQTR